MECHKSVHILSLYDIARWQIKELAESDDDGEESIIAHVPVLQRGEVWTPSKIELLWDSLFQGFPFGSIILSPVISHQLKNTRSTLKPTHHLLDGQQRTNAIAWGFMNPWTLDDTAKEKLKQVVWLDLQPNDSKKLNRRFLFRVTTKAHPWGFKADAQGSVLSVTDRRLQKPAEGSVRPNLWQAYPVKANLPVPLSLLIKHYRGDEVEWNLLREELAESQSESVGFKEKMHNVADGISRLDEGQRRIIEQGLAQALRTPVVCIEVRQSHAEEIRDIEAIFQRLNTQGTPLTPEELAYSAIKAYLPDVGNALATLDDKLRHAPESRLVAMGSRVVKTRTDSGHQKTALAAAINIQNIRQMADSGEGNDLAILKDYLCSEYDSGRTELATALHWVDDNLCISDDRPWGLPAYLRSYLAWQNPELFTWLLWFAGNIEYKQLSDKESKKLLAILTNLHWFAEYPEKTVNGLVEHLPDCQKLREFKLSHIKAGRRHNKALYYQPLAPKQLRRAIELNASLDGYGLNNTAWENYWSGLYKNIKAIESSLSDEHCADLTHQVMRIMSKKSLLLYCQRDYIRRRFEGFDPSDKLMWQGHNRPWDYDHILSSNTLKHRISKSDQDDQYLYICRLWQNSIGNQFAIDLSTNRSWGDSRTPEEKRAKLTAEPDSVIDPTAEKFYDGLAFTKADAADPQKVRAFISAAQSRLIAVYTAWYEDLAVAEI